MKTLRRFMIRASVVTALAISSLIAIPLAGHVPHASACGGTTVYANGSAIGVAFHYDSCSHQVSTDVYYEPGQCSQYTQPQYLYFLEAKAWEYNNDGTYSKPGDTKSNFSDCSTSTGYHPITCGSNRVGHGEGLLEYYLNGNGPYTAEDDNTGNITFTC